MRREQLEHLIRAAATIAEDDEVVVIGSQAILAQVSDPPSELCRSMEADLWPRNHPERWELVDGSIGELSPFHETFGYYAQGVGPETATLPEGWEERVVPLRTGGVTGLCLEVHDLVISKYVAAREKDLEFTSAALSYGLVQPEVLLERLSDTPITRNRRSRIAALVRRDAADAARRIEADGPP